MSISLKNDVIDKVGSPRSVDITEEINIDYFSHSQIDIIDSDGKLQQTFLANNRSMCSAFISKPLNIVEHVS